MEKLLKMSAIIVSKNYENFMYCYREMRGGESLCNIRIHVFGSFTCRDRYKVRCLNL